MQNIRKYLCNKPTNIYESISPIYYTLKLFGLASYSLNFKNGKIKTSFSSYIMFLCFFAFYCICFVDLIQIDTKTYSPEGKPILIYGFIFLYHFQYFTILFIVIYNFVMLKNVIKLLKHLETFDEHTDQIGWKFKVNHERNYWISIFWIVLNLILLCCAYYFQMLTMPIPDQIVLSDHINLLIYCIVTNVFSLCLLQFIIGVHWVESRFEILNKNAR